MSEPLYIERAVAATLKASPEMAALCSGKIFPLKIPQGITLPAVVYQRIASDPYYTLQGYSSVSVTLTINCFSMRYDEAKTLALAVRKVMGAAPLNAVFAGERDLMNEHGNVFCVNAEYRCQQTGGYCYGEL